jgi:Fic family protein
MTGFAPTYTVSIPLLEMIKRIAVLAHNLNRQAVPDVVYAELQAEAAAVSTYTSTSIEGNPLPLTKVKRLIKQQPQHLRQSEREILNYNQTLVGLNEMSGGPLTSELVFRIHRGVMKQLLPDHQVGQWRSEPVVVKDPRSGEIVYLPPDAADVAPLMDDLFAFVRAKRRRLDPIILAGLVHKQMVVIHPFIDGNGRTIRLATNHLLADLGLNTFNLFSFENYYNQNVTHYFQQVGLFGNYYDLAVELDFTPWLEYFSGGILDELLRVQKVLADRQVTPETTLQLHHRLILDHIDKVGYINDRAYAQLTDRAKATRALDFKKLIMLGLIERRGRGRSTYYQRTRDLA